MNPSENVITTLSPSEGTGHPRLLSVVPFDLAKILAEIQNEEDQSVND